MKDLRIVAGVIGALFVAFGIAILAMGADFAEDNRRLVLEGERARATIETKRIHRSYDSATRRYGIPHHYVTYTFKLPDGTVQRNEEAIGEDFYVTIEPGTVYAVTYWPEGPALSTLYEIELGQGVQSFRDFAWIMFAIAAVFLGYATHHRWLAWLGRGR